MLYKTHGTCSHQISFDLQNGNIDNFHCVGGCNGNLKGISSLVEGMNANEVMAKLEGIRCGLKSTSCPDQLAKAIKEALQRAE